MTTKPLRKLIPAEDSLVRYLLAHVDRKDLIDKLSSNCYVQDLPDGGMGSFRFEGEDKRTFGSELVGGKFVDSDGVDVLVSIYLDQSGNLFELDSWKANFSPRISDPDVSRLVIF
jgi:hypothetical protein